MSKKKQVRAKFRSDVLERDRYRCRNCDKLGKDRQDTSDSPGWKKFHKHVKDESALVNLDAHHIIPREEMPNGGYVKENGISLCDDCHMMAEENLGLYVEKKIKTDIDWIHPEFEPSLLYMKIDSSYEQAYEASLKLA